MLLSSFQSSRSLTVPSNKKTTLWMGELEPWMDEVYLQKLWFNFNLKVDTKVIRKKYTLDSLGYAFVEFGSSSAAQSALDMFNGEAIPDTSCTFKLKWASVGGLIDKKQPEYSIFLGDLSNECTESLLLYIFSSRYLSCKTAKIMTDPRTGLPRGYGFVRFNDPIDQKQALDEMQGAVIGNRPIRVSLATPKAYRIAANPTKVLPSSAPSINTTVFVGGLSCPIREDELKQYFEIFGDIIYVKIPVGKGCGFVQFVSRQSAETAIEQMNGYQIGSSRIRLSWGRSQNQQPQQQQTILQRDITSHHYDLVQQQHPSFDQDRGFSRSFDHYSSFFSDHHNDGFATTNADYCRHLFT